MVDSKIAADSELFNTLSHERTFDRNCYPWLLRSGETTAITRLDHLPVQKRAQKNQAINEP